MELQKPTDAELLDISRRCVKKGQRLHEKLKTWDETDISECLSMRALYREGGLTAYVAI